MNETALEIKFNRAISQQLIVTRLAELVCQYYVICFTGVDWLSTPMDITSSDIKRTWVRILRDTSKTLFFVMSEIGLKLNQHPVQWTTEGKAIGASSSD
jgi:hypothetical protein